MNACLDDPMTRKNPLVEVLESIFWGDRIDARDVSVVVRHRGAPYDILSIPGADMIPFGRGGIRVKAQGETSMDYADTIPLPLHRVLKIINERDGTLLYEKKGR